MKSAIKLNVYLTPYMLHYTWKIRLFREFSISNAVLALLRDNIKQKPMKWIVYLNIYGYWTKTFFKFHESID